MRQGRWGAVQVALSGGHGVGQMFAHRFSREPRVLAWPSDETAFHGPQERVWGWVAEGSMHELDIAGSVVVNGSMGLNVLVGIRDFLVPNCRLRPLVCQIGN